MCEFVYPECDGYRRDRKLLSQTDEEKCNEELEQVKKRIETVRAEASLSPECHKLVTQDMILECLPVEE